MRYVGRWEKRYSSGGDPFYVWVCMPRIEDAYLEAVIYLYPSELTASRGEAIGGTGFLMMRPLDNEPPFGVMYAVTNAHVIEPDGGNSPVIRLNTVDGNR